MTEQQFGAIVGLVIGYTFVFDLIDLQPQVGSFGFLRGLSYWFYLTFRALLAVLASLLIHQINPDLALPIIALVAVLGSVTFLQNFSMNIGGSDIAKLSNLVDNYKGRMVAEEGTRRAKRSESAALRVQRDMVRAFDEEELEDALRQMLLQGQWTGEQINAHVQTLKQTAGERRPYLKSMMAFQIADMNVEHARFLLRERPQRPALTGTTGR